MIVTEGIPSLSVSGLLTYDSCVDSDRLLLLWEEEKHVVLCTLLPHLLRYGLHTPETHYY